MEDKSLELIDQMRSLEQDIVSTTDNKELQKLVDLFNLNIRKKDLIRAGKLSDVQDKIQQQMQERVENHAHEFSNKDLLEYYKVIEDTVGKASQLITPDVMPAIQINSQNLTIAVGNNNLSQESKEKVVSTVQDILAKIKEQPVIDLEPVEVKEENLDEFGPDGQ